MSQPGATLRRLREQSGLPLREVSRRTGVSVSVLSKLENGKLGLSYRRLAQISAGLEIEVGRLFEAPQPAPAIGRRSIRRASDPDAAHPAADLLHKRLSPRILELAAHPGDERLELRRRPGDLFAFVIEGEAALHTDLYVPLRLGAGDSIYFDGATGHAWIKAGPGACRVLTVSSGDEG
ncbi:MAG: XRE family transcriptional regulator [Phenylobacterium sp.]|nr:MAG: XRE family transcriptional regulator [Phenylobacterium sp.]